MNTVVQRVLRAAVLSGGLLVAAAGTAAAHDAPSGSQVDLLGGVGAKGVVSAGVSLDDGVVSGRGVVTVHDHSAKSTAKGPRKAPGTVRARLSATADVEARAKARATADIKARAKARARADVKARTTADIDGVAAADVEVKAGAKARATARIKARAAIEARAKARVTADVKAGTKVTDTVAAATHAVAELGVGVGVGTPGVAGVLSADLATWEPVPGVLSSWQGNSTPITGLSVPNGTVADLLGLQVGLADASDTADSSGSGGEGRTRDGKDRFDDPGVTVRFGRPTDNDRERGSSTDQNVRRPSRPAHGVRVLVGTGSGDGVAVGSRGSSTRGGAADGGRCILRAAPSAAALAPAGSDPATALLGVLVALLTTAGLLRTRRLGRKEGSQPERSLT